MSTDRSGPQKFKFESERIVPRGMWGGFLVGFFRLFLLEIEGQKSAEKFQNVRRIVELEES